MRIKLTQEEAWQIIVDNGYRKDYKLAKILARQPYYAFMYACYVRGVRWLRAERTLIKDVYYGYQYASRVTKERYTVKKEARYLRNREDEYGSRQAYIDEFLDGIDPKLKRHPIVRKKGPGRPKKPPELKHIIHKYVRKK